jgi:uncharacterized protein DUF4386
MTRATNARLAGFVFLLYIATGITSLILFAKATSGAEGTAATLASIAGHATLVRLTLVLAMVEVVCAVVLGVTLYALTRDVDADLALLAMSFRLAEGIVAAVSCVRTLALLWVATGAATAAAMAPAAATALGTVLLKSGGWTATISATCFAMGSTIFCYLFLRGRSIPVALSWLGLIASILLVAALPAQLAGFLRGPMTQCLWIPMAVFEIWLALWLLIKGIRDASPLRL